MSDVTDMLAAARNGTLAQDDQRLQRLRQQANQGATQAVRDLNEIILAGGAHSGSANKVI